MDWATITDRKLVKDEDVPLKVRMVERASTKQWLVDILKDKIISTKNGLKRVVYKDTQGRKMGEI
jgi:hypothetical protein